MPVDISFYQNLKKELDPFNAQLVAVSKTKPPTDILSVYELDHKDFGENYVQEFCTKYEELPNDIHWHYIGHLQTNKVKLIVGKTHLIHGVDSLRLLQQIQKEAAKAGKQVNVLLQMHIADEETKFGLNEMELWQLVELLQNDPNNYNYIAVQGLMGMASFVDDHTKIEKEFNQLNNYYQQLQKTNFTKTQHKIQTLSMGMSSDYKIALNCGSNLIRIGSSIFGQRNYNS
jgi:PLP dependent protein